MQGSDHDPGTRTLLEHDKLVGIITLSDLLEVKQSDPGRRLSLQDVARELGGLTVGTTMSKNPLYVHAHDPLGHAAELMLEHKIGGLPVTDADERVLGLITESDIFRVLAKHWREDNLLFSGARAPQ